MAEKEEWDAADVERLREAANPAASAAGLAFQSHQSIPPRQRQSANHASPTHHVSDQSANHVSTSCHVSDNHSITSVPPATLAAVSQSRQSLHHGRGGGDYHRGSGQPVPHWSLRHRVAGQGKGGYREKTLDQHLFLSLCLVYVYTSIHPTCTVIVARQDDY